jgi:hypothetical protein
MPRRRAISACVSFFARSAGPEAIGKDASVHEDPAIPQDHACRRTGGSRVAQVPRCWEPAQEKQRVADVKCFDGCSVACLMFKVRHLLES